MPAWVSVAVRPVPRDRAVFVRFGANIFAAGWFDWPGKWFMLVPGGGREEIADPTVWFDRDAPDISEEEERRIVFGAEQTSARPQRGPRQLGLNFEVGGSQTLSRR